MLCRVCGKEMELVEVLHNKERNVTLQYAIPFSAEKRDVELYRCSSCFHMEIEYIIPDKYYDDYTLVEESNENGENTRYSASFLTYYNEKFKELASYAFSTKKVIDIGCGAGILMKKELQYFDECIGVEPSKTQSRIGKNLGLNIINDYFSEGLGLEEGSYSAFVSTQVFEHLTMINEILGYAKKLLEKGGVGLIEVPNGQKAYFEKCYYDIFPDHVNYFSPQSLCILAARHGFEVIKVSEEFNRNHMSLYVRKPFDNVDSFELAIKRDKKDLNDIIKNYSAISIWGAGAKARSFIQLIDAQEKIVHIFDINEMCWGQYLDGMNVPIERPERSSILESDAVLVFAGAFTKEIIDQLKNVYGYKKDIVCFDKGIYIDSFSC